MTHLFSLKHESWWRDRAGVTSLPTFFVWIVIIICILPFLLNLLGYDFSSQKSAYSLLQITEKLQITENSRDAIVDQMHHLLGGSFLHTILEWSAVCAAIFTVILAFSYFSIKHDVTTPIIGVTLLCAGIMDAFHTFAADRLIDAVANNEHLIPFTWAICRIGNALLTLFGVSLFLISRPKRWQGNVTFIILVSVIFAMISYGIINFCITQESLPKTLFPDALITRPWDLLPLLLFLISGVWIYPRFYQKNPSLFSHALIISTIPNAVTQMHMVFGSTTLFDNHFNIAHFLKIIAYLVPLAGLVFDYSYTHQEVNQINNNLSKEIEERKQIESFLQESRVHESEKARQLEQTLKELKKTQSQLIQSEKMSSLGQLVAGIAHEINNPVNFIHGNIFYVHQYMEDLLELLNIYQANYSISPEIQEKADEIDLTFLIKDLPHLLNSMKSGTTRLIDIVQSLRMFSHLQESELKEVNIHHGIDSSLIFLQHRFKNTTAFSDIKILKFYGDLPLVECYSGDMNQVFLNLLNNAIDAILEDYNFRYSSNIHPKNGVIKITTKNLGNDRIEIRIADNGIGINPENKKLLFNPFFTTKPIGKGTGLGLSICYQVITEKHGGSLRYVSEVNEGSEFICEIPLRQTQ
jgi:two-component system, NtrC family, sensor kinase